MEMDPREGKQKIETRVTCVLVDERDRRFLGTDKKNTERREHLLLRNELAKTFRVHFHA